VRSADWIHAKRQRAWAFGREERDRLLAEFQERYRLPVTPAPAKIIDELLTDFMQVRLRYRSLPPDRFAHTTIEEGAIVVSVSDDIRTIPGVKDAEGTANVAKWHEAVHALRDVEMLQRPSSMMLPGFESEPEIVCSRAAGKRVARWDEQAEREFWAEEAGRAAAVSLPALQRTNPFIELIHRAWSASGPVRGGFPLLYASAEAIGVNISALVKQLQFEGLIVVQKERGRSEVLVQPALLEVGQA
jgi:hypothetical protein